MGVPFRFMVLVRVKFSATMKHIWTQSLSEPANTHIEVDRYILSTYIRCGLMYLIILDRIYF